VRRESRLDSCPSSHLIAEKYTPLSSANRIWRKARRVNNPAFISPCQPYRDPQALPRFLFLLPRPPIYPSPLPECGRELLTIHPSILVMPNERDPVDALAIIGLSVKFPQDATTPDAFWEMLREGRSAASRVPADRFNVDGE
jgi:hypothetical protein